MYIIQKNATENGGRSALQSWSSVNIPNGYALCPDAFFDVFYSTTPAGFVNIELSGNIVTAMTVNQEALDAYIASHPQEPEETADVAEEDK